MSYDEPMDWVVYPPTDEHGSFYYGVRALPDFKLFIASGCCAALLVKTDRMGCEAACSKCMRKYPLSPYNGFDGEDEPFTLYWGKFVWGKVESVMTEWIDFYLNITKGGEKDIQFRFDGMTAEEQNLG